MSVSYSSPDSWVCRTVEALSLGLLWRNLLAITRLPKQKAVFFRSHKKYLMIIFVQDYMYLSPQHYQQDANLEQACNVN